MDKKTFGQLGEKKAEAFLMEKGYEILDRNFLKRSGEIDLIVFDPFEQEYVFVEVKTRKSNLYGYPEEFVDDEKLEKISSTAEIWLDLNGKAEANWRIDIIAISKQGFNFEIHHLENVI